MELATITVTDEELIQLPLVTSQTLQEYVGYVVPADGPVDAKRNAVYHLTCLEEVYDPEETDMFGIASTDQHYREKHCLYCGKPLPFD